MNVFVFVVFLCIVDFDWCWKFFDVLIVCEIYLILEVCSVVFVVEQNCVYCDIDDVDQVVWYLVVFDLVGCLVGYLCVLLFDV